MYRWYRFYKSWLYLFAEPRQPYHLIDFDEWTWLGIL